MPATRTIQTPVVQAARAPTAASSRGRAGRRRAMTTTRPSTVKLSASAELPHLAAASRSPSRQMLPMRVVQTSNVQATSATVALWRRIPGDGRGGVVAVTNRMTPASVEQCSLGIGADGAGDARVGQALHEDPAAAVDRRRPPAAQRRLVAGTWVALVLVEPPPRVVLGLDLHDAIAGDLGEDRRRRDGQAARVAAHDALGDAAADEVPLAVEQHAVGTQAQPLERPAGGQPLRFAHAQIVALVVGGVAHRPGRAPAGDAIEERLALLRRELLGVTHLVHPAIARQHGGTERERTGPRAPSHLVHAHDHLVAGIPELALAGQRWRLALQCLAENRCRRGHRGQPTSPARARRSTLSGPPTVGSTPWPRVRRTATPPRQATCDPGTGSRSATASTGRGQGGSRSSSGWMGATGYGAAAMAPSCPACSAATRCVPRAGGAGGRRSAACHRRQKSWGSRGRLSPAWPRWPPRRPRARW